MDRLWSRGTPRYKTSWRARPLISLILSCPIRKPPSPLARRLRAVSRRATHGLAEEVPSPTFTLVQTYESPSLLITHVDLYRVENASELREFGLAEALDEGVVLVEWPERAEAELHRLSANRLDISLSLMPEGGHRARLRGWGNWAVRLGELAV